MAYTDANLQADLAILKNNPQTGLAVRGAIARISENMIGKSIETQTKYYELTEEFINLLKGYTENGNGSQSTAEIINARNGEPSLKTRLDKDKNELLAEIAQKANISYVDALKLEVAKGGPKGLFYSIASLKSEYPNGSEDGGTWLVIDSTFVGVAHSFIWDETTSEWVDLGAYQSDYIPRRSITNDKYSDESITIDKTNFVKVGKNKLDSSKLASGYYGTNGEYFVDDGYKHSEPIPVSTGGTWSFSRDINLNTSVRERSEISFITAYNNDVAVPSAGERNVSKYVVPAGIDRIVLSTPTATWDRKVQMEFGDDITTFEKYKRTINNFHAPIDNEDIAFNSLDVSKLKIQEGTLPTRLYFLNGSLNSGQFNSVSSNRVSTKELHFAKKGSRIAFSNVEGVEFTVHLLTGSEVYKSNTGWSSVPYIFQEDTYYRISMRYANDSATPESSLSFFNDSIYFSSGGENAVLLKGELETSNAGRALIMPTNYPVVVGTQANVYLDNVLQYGNAYTAENFRVRGKGGIIAGGYQFTASSDVDLNFDYYTGRQLVMTKKLSVKTVPENAGSGLTKNVIMIGESTTPVELITELNRMFDSDPMNFVPMGTRGIGVDKHEGRGGWKISDLINQSNYKNLPNAFLNPATNTFDFPWYMAQQGYTKVDIVTLLFGFNDKYEGRTNAQIIADYEQVIKSIRLFDPTIKIGIGLTSLPSKHPNLNGADLKNDMLGLISELINKYDGRESEGFYIIPVYLNVDPINDMELIQVPLSLRNPTITTVGTDMPHPFHPGYLKFADVFYSMFKYMA